MALASSATVTAKAFKSGSNPSAVAAASFTNSGTGRTYYVAKSGSNSNSCAQAQTQSTPKLTIGAGIACMQGGDRLEIKQGTYEETIPNPPSGTAGAHTVLATFGATSGATGDIVTFTRNTTNINFYSGGISYVDLTGRFVFDGTGTVTSFNGLAFNKLINNGSHHITFDGIRITNYAGMAVNIASEYITFRNCRIDNNGKQLDAFNQAGYAFYIGGSNNLVENCELDHQGGYAVHQYSQDQNPSNNIYRYNSIHDNGQTIAPYNTACGILIHGNGSNNQVYGNLIYNNPRGYGIMVSSGTNTKIYNNTVYNNGADVGAANIGIFGGTAAVVKNNIAYGNNSIINDGTGTSLSNNLITDPKFVSLSNYDFHLQSTSPAINAGVSITEVTTDIDGTPRPQGGAFDIGAYEYR